MKPIMATASGEIYNTAGLQLRAEIGFTTMIYHGVAANREWEKQIRRTHEAGMSAVVRWPDWGLLHMLGEEHAFRAYDGKHNAGDGGGVAGPSLWNPEAEQVGIDSLHALVEMGVDGVLVKMLECDRPYPTDWYPLGGDSQKYTTAYWAYDADAKRSWAEHSGEEIPFERASGSPQNGLELEFYRWYQGGWIGRLQRLTDAVLGAGLKQIFTWYIPLDFWDAENMADGTASSVEPIEGWRQTVLTAGGIPVTVTPQLFGLWERWAAPGQDTMRQAIGNLGWTSIVGVGLCASLPQSVENLSYNAVRAAEIGFSGIYGASHYLAERAEEAKVAMTDALSHFREGGE